MPIPHAAVERIVAILDLMRSIQQDFNPGNADGDLFRSVCVLVHVCGYRENGLPSVHGNEALQQCREHFEGVLCFCRPYEVTWREWPRINRDFRISRNRDLLCWYDSRFNPLRRR